MSTENPVNYQAVLDDLFKRREELNVAIAAIERIMGTVPSSGTKDGAYAANIPGDAFFGMTVADAATKYLRIVKRPQPVAMITQALADGGYLFQTETPQNTVASVLNRDDARGGEIVRTGKNVFGLAEWYPNRPKRKKGNGSVEELANNSVDADFEETEKKLTETSIQ